MKKEKILREKKFSVSIQTSRKKRSASALLIPKKLFPVLDRLGRDKNRTQILNYLLIKYRKFCALGQMDFSQRVKTLYQDPGQNLKRVSFKPDNQDWIELGILANALGMSRTRLFSLFLDFENRQIAEFFELPKVKSEVAYLDNYRPQFIWKILRKETGFQRVLKHLRV